ncbi:uncharacterized protein LOC125658973 isoform X2 [Ostrea edulis]|nr:uncharacterized protein LOC125658973 isoform X2 [Ostrea edulis]
MMIRWKNPFHSTTRAKLCGPVIFLIAMILIYRCFHQEKDTTNLISGFLNTSHSGFLENVKKFLLNIKERDKKYPNMRLGIVLVFVTTYASDSVDYASPLVFDALYYVNHNPEVVKAGIHTPEQAKNHWLTHGIDKGLQAIGSFHVKQYLRRYHDLSLAFHTNYRQAIDHYIQHVDSEHRVGYMEGGFGGVWTISGHGIYLGASARMGGAIDSLTWNNRELVNSYDHGRELQMACNSNTYAECYNPTEAGGRDDSTSAHTHTHIDWVRASGNVLESQVHPAFWLRPGVHETIDTTISGCTRGSQALNHQSTYRYPFHKKVTIGVQGIDNCIEFVSNFTIGGDWPADLKFIQMEAPTGYMAGDLNQTYYFNPQTVSMEIQKNHNPVVLSTHDNQYAVGVYTPPGQDSDVAVYYGVHVFRLGTFDNDTAKWNVVYRKFRTHGNQPVQYVYKTYICIGSLGMVSNCLHKITQRHR